MNIAVLPLLLAAPASAANVRATVLDRDGSPVKDAVVFVYEVKGRKFKPPAEPYEMDQIDKEFVPRMLPVLVGGKVAFPNKDNVHHQIYSFSQAKNFEIDLYKGEPGAVSFDKVGVVKLGCNIHDWMRGFILVLSNPYFAVTDAEGRAVLKGVPKDKGLELAVFHERLRGSVEKTRRPVRWGKKGAVWKLPLKRARKNKRPAVEEY